MDDLVRWLGEQLDEEQRAAEDALKRTTTTRRRIGGQWVEDKVEPPEWRRSAWPPARVLREIDAKRTLLALHTPEWSIVEWPHDQNGKGEAQVCRSCGNRDIDSWLNWRRLGDGDLPEGVKPPYVVAPCQVLRLLALPYSDRIGYREEWRP